MKSSHSSRAQSMKGSSCMISPEWIRPSWELTPMIQGTFVNVSFWIISSGWEAKNVSSLRTVSTVGAKRSIGSRGGF